MISSYWPQSGVILRLSPRLTTHRQGLAYHQSLGISWSRQVQERVRLKWWESKQEKPFSSWVREWKRRHLLKGETDPSRTRPFPIKRQRKSSHLSVTFLIPPTYCLRPSNDLFSLSPRKLDYMPGDQMPKFLWPAAASTTPGIANITFDRQ